MECIRVKIGDAIEYDARGGGVDAYASAGTSFTAARVMDVDPDTPLVCLVQTSPYEPLQTVDLRDVAYKIVYAVGELSMLSSDMIGWQVEIAADTPQVPPVLELAVIKRVDADINCAFVVFASGRKDWVDLTLSTFKVRGHFEPSSADIAEDTEAQATDDDGTSAAPVTTIVGDEDEKKQSIQVKTIIDAESKDIGRPLLIVPRLNVPVRVGEIIPTTISGQEPNELAHDDTADGEICTSNHRDQLPVPEVTSFDWYSEGGHVELYDTRGHFVEGAVLCARVSEGQLQLYNERRHFFQVSTATQSLRVVVHGLLALKCIPLGQLVDVYSPMTASFRTGTVLKDAEVGKLTPILYAPGAVEWTDLTSQTFKLCFNTLPATATGPNAIRAPVQSLPSDVISAPSRASNSPPKERPRRIHGSPTKGYAQPQRPVEWPTLEVGQSIEIYDEQIRHYMKYLVARVDVFRAHQYDFTQAAASSSTHIGLKRFSANLKRLRCRIPVSAAHWDSIFLALLSQRVDVYDKATKNVQSGKVIEILPTEKKLVVRYKDNTRQCIDVCTTKVKLRLQGEPDPPEVSTDDVATSNCKTEESKASASLVTACHEPATDDKSDDGKMFTPVKLPQEHVERTTPILSRRTSDPALSSANAIAPTLHHSVTLHNLVPNESTSSPRGSGPLMLRPLDFSVLRPTNQAVSEAVTADTGALTLQWEEVWAEEIDSSGSVIGYVNVVTGIRQTETPLWIQCVDADSGRKQLINTATHTTFPLPTSSRSSTPRSGGRVSLPVGPIEAVREVNR